MPAVSMPTPGAGPSFALRPAGGGIFVALASLLHTCPGGGFGIDGFEGIGCGLSGVLISLAQQLDERSHRRFAIVAKFS